MASLAAPPPSGGGDTSFESGLGAVLSDAYDVATGATDVPSEGGDGTPETEWTGDAPAEGADVIPGLEEASASAALPPEGTPPTPAATTPAAASAKEPYPLSADGKTYMVPKAELAQLGTVRQYFDGVSRFFQTPEAAQNAYAMSSDFQMMQNDWLNGSDASIDAMLNHWAGGNYADNPVMQQRFQSSFQKMAERAPQILKSTNPTAYRAMLGNLARFNGTVGADGQIQWGDAISPASGLLMDAVGLAYEQAAQTQSPFDLRRAQELDYAVTGTFKNELPKLDPQAQQRAQFEREQATFRQDQARMEANVTNAWNKQNVEGLKFNAVDQEIDRMLAKYRQASGISEKTYADMKSGILRDLVGDFRNGTIGGQMREMDPEWVTLHEQEFRSLVNDFRQGWKNDPHGQRVQARVDPYIQSFLSRAKRLIPALAKARIESKKPAASAPTRRSAAAPAATPTPPGQAARVSREAADDWWNNEWKGIRAAV